MFVIPTAAVIVTAVVLMGPGSQRSVLAARVRGAAVPGGRTMALRIETVRSLYGVAEPAALGGLTVVASLPGSPFPTWTGETKADGVAEVRLEGAVPLTGSVSIKVVSIAGMARPRLLAEGRIPLRNAPSPFVQLGTLQGTTRGDLPVRVDAVRGVMAAPFPEELRLFVGSGGPGGRAEVTLSGVGVALTTERLTTDDRGIATVSVKALAHQVDLVVDAQAGARAGHWEGTLPVVPGAIWISPAEPGAPLSVVSPSPRAHAYVSLWSEEGRVFGAAVPLKRDDAGFFRGELGPSLPPSARLLYAVVAGDPVERGAGTVAWPIQPPEGAIFARSIDLLLDGVPGAVEREQARVLVARRAAALVVAAAAIVEILLLVLQSRASQRRLEEHLLVASGSESGDGPLPRQDRVALLKSAREYPVLRLLLGIAVVALGFAIVAALATLR